MTRYKLRVCQYHRVLNTKSTALMHGEHCYVLYTFRFPVIILTPLPLTHGIVYVKCSVKIKRLKRTPTLHKRQHLLPPAESVLYERCSVDSGRDNSPYNVWPYRHSASFLKG